eukprot:gene4895-4060_t
MHVLPTALEAFVRKGFQGVRVGVFCARGEADADDLENDGFAYGGSTSLYSLQLFERL